MQSTTVWGEETAGEEADGAGEGDEGDRDPFVYGTLSGILSPHWRRSAITLILWLSMVIAGARLREGGQTAI